MFQFKKPLRRSEKILLLLLIIALIAVALRWKTVKEGFVKGWKAYSIEKWFDRN
jgi:hypothetical protein